jgi:hypothetical protein
MMMTINETKRIRMACGTKMFEVKGTNLNAVELEKYFDSDAPFGFHCRIYNDNTEAICTCYYD